MKNENKRVNVLTLVYASFNYILLFIAFYPKLGKSKNNNICTRPFYQNMLCTVQTIKIGIKLL